MLPNFPSQSLVPLRCACLAPWLDWLPRYGGLVPQDALVWRHIWTLSGLPNFRVGSLVASPVESDELGFPGCESDELGFPDCLVCSAKLTEEAPFLKMQRRWCFIGDTRVQEDVATFAYPTFPLAFELIFRGMAEALEKLDLSFLQESIPVPDHFRGEASPITPLHYAALLGNVRCLSVLIQRLTISPMGDNGVLKRDFLFCFDSRSPFGDREGVLVLLQQHFDLRENEAFDLEEMLKIAASLGQVEMLRFLLKQSFSKSLSCYRALLYAIHASQNECAAFLLENGDCGELNVCYDTSVLMDAATAGNAEGVRLLLEHGADPDLPDYWGDPALHLAIEEGQIACCRVLLENGARPDIKNQFGNDARHLWERSINSDDLLDLEFPYRCYNLAEHPSFSHLDLPSDDQDPPCNVQ